MKQVRDAVLFLSQKKWTFSSIIDQAILSKHFQECYISWCAVCRPSKGFKTKEILNPHWLLQSWICKHKSLSWGRPVAYFFSSWFLWVASAGYFSKAACGFTFSFCLGRGIIALSGKATCTDVMRSMNSPWHRRLL